MGNNAASNNEQVRLKKKKKIWKNYAKYGLDPVSELDPEPEPERNKSLRFHNTGKSKYEQDTVS
jgi:hypothetical protein